MNLEVKYREHPTICALFSVYVGEKSLYSNVLGALLCDPEI